MNESKSSRKSSTRPRAKTRAKPSSKPRAQSQRARSRAKPIVEEIAELRALSVPDLVQRYEGAYGKPPRVKNKAWLWRRIAWKLQEAAFGGLSGAAKGRLDELIAEIDLPLGDRQTVRGNVQHTKPGEPPVGTTLTRVWRGTEIRVTAVDGGGWEYEGVVHRSLSAVARSITGARWNGRLFFGLTKRKAKP